MKSNNLKNKISSFFLSLNSISYFFSFFLSTISILWTSIEIIDYVGYKLTFLKSNPTNSIYLILIHAITVGFIALYVREKSSNGNRKFVKVKESALSHDLIESLNTALSNKSYEEVIRLGSVLSRPLFISGYYLARLEVGVLVEEAAAITNNKTEQIKALIDSIGWSSIELGKFDCALKSIEYGQKIATDEKNFFYISKSFRHLGVIYRRKNNFEKAEIQYKRALNIANKLMNETEKNESLAGTYYALSNLYYLKSNYKKAEKYINDSIVYFNKNNDTVRLNLSILKKADIFISLKKKSEAKDLYRRSLNIAEKITHPLHIVRGSIGLSKIYLEDENWKKSLKYIRRAEEVGLQLRSINELDEINQVLDKIPTEEKKILNFKTN